MSLRISYLFGIILWLSFLLLSLLHECSAMDSRSTTYISLPSHIVISRKLLATNFDFSVFQRHHHQRRHQRTHFPPMMEDSDPSGNEIDLRYGVEKRLVPTGPNPLHH
ncbi:hypothetical protein AQUCO_01700352v1 [Aquilegia coerulea]|uniref:CLAVATA3/ESR-like protein n=1 Tax=Aquilegia coerulea TaxID=218851 RepID=A0A2G5DMF7_AQUCA|nr:hypothetical protein AQUCO_01700352v1 [Aquilegia coerulea]